MESGFLAAWVWSVQGRGLTCGCARSEWVWMTFLMLKRHQIEREMRIYIYIYIYKYPYVHAYIYMFIYMHICIYIPICVYVYICIGLYTTTTYRTCKWNFELNTWKMDNCRWVKASLQWDAAEYPALTRRVRRPTTRWTIHSVHVWSVSTEEVLDLPAKKSLTTMSPG